MHALFDAGRRVDDKRIGDPPPTEFWPKGFHQVSVCHAFSGKMAPYPKNYQNFAPFRPADIQRQRGLDDENRRTNRKAAVAPKEITHAKNKKRLKLFRRLRVGRSVVLG